MKSSKEEKIKDKRKIYLDTNLQIIFGITLTYIMGVSIITPAFPKIITELNISEKEIGLLISVFALPGILLTPILGVLADRWGRKKIIIPALMLFGLAGGVCSLVNGFKYLLVLRFIQGIGAASLGSLTVTIIGDIYSGKERTAAIGYYSGIRNIGLASFPVIGGAMAMGGWRYPFLLFFIAIPVGLLVLSFLKNPEPKNDQSLLEHLSGLSKSIKNRRVIGLFIISILSFIVYYGSYMTYFPILMGHSFGASPLIIGIIISTMFFTAAFASSKLGKLIKIYSEKTFLEIAFVLYALALMIMSFASKLWLFFASVLIFGTGHGIIYPIIQALLAELAPLEYRATFMSVSGMTFMVGQTLGPLLMGVVISVWGIGGVFYTGAALSIVLFIIAFRWL